MITSGREREEDRRKREGVRKEGMLSEGPWRERDRERRKRIEGGRSMCRREENRKRRGKSRKR